MWALILLICSPFCDEREILDTFNSLEDCQAAVEERWADLEQGNVMICWKAEEIET